ncbi:MULTISPECIES: hypothetical protein [Clostridium]|jgi:predicted hydrolase (HD superfamily)|uniref:hypothetical protein n=1 Tax=Clostridium TaxID=1485 RepID=UPI00242E637E|nr:hypothetical protein [Clostridium tyrobutyricum]
MNSIEVTKELFSQLTEILNGKLQKNNKVINEITNDDIADLLIHPESLHTIDLNNPQKHIAAINAYASLENMEGLARGIIGEDKYFELKNVLYDYSKDLDKEEIEKYIKECINRLKLKKTSPEIMGMALCIMTHMINKAQNKY